MSGDTSMRSTALPVLHYLAPVLAILYYACARIVATCFLHEPSRKDAVRRLLAVGLLVAVLVTLVAQATTYFVQALLHPGRSATQDCVIYLLVSVFTYGYLSLNLLEEHRIIWHPFLGCVVTATLLEIPLTVLELVAQTRGDDYEFGRVALQTARSLLLIAFLLSGGWFALQDRLPKHHKQDDTEPLLTDGTNGSVAKAGEYGSLPDDGDSDVDSDEEEPENIKELKHQQKKRLRESGSWLKYLKDFRIFIPMLWPSRNRFVQACLAVISLVLVAQRFLNVLVPRQLGIITEKLAGDKGNGNFPWQAVGTWMLLSWLNSSAGVAIVQSLAELPVQQFAYKSIGATSFAHIMRLSMDFHSDKNSGELIRAIDQGQNLQGLLEFTCFQVGPMFIDLVIAFVYVYVLFDIYMSFILVFVGIAYIWVGAKTTIWSVKRRRRFNTAWRNESKVQNEAINNWQTVSHFNRGQYECNRYNNSIDVFNAAEMSYYFAYYVGGGTQSLIMVLGRLAATFLAIYRVSQGTAPLGNFIALTAYWRSIEGPLAQVSWSIRRVTQMLTDSERLLQLLQTKSSVSDIPDATELVIKDGHVEFENVDFAYDTRRPVLKDVTFAAKPGQTIALVGETGGGKSTILKLLYRYYDVSGGSIRIDGQDVRGVTLDSLRDSFGMVPQDPSLFNISLMDNIKYARLDATDEEVKDACRAAAIHDKIETFPDKYQSKVGERGVKLSGGELQRVSIARAILRQPKIVLLDEATSMIDAETEALIQEAFKRLTASRTTFIIAHRLSTIQHADLILVINDGQIIERGSHDDLFRKNGKYTALWSKQLSKVAANDPALIDVDAVEMPGPNRGESSD